MTTYLVASAVQINSGTFLPGDIVDAGGARFTDRVVLPSGGSPELPVEYRGMVLDGSVSFDGSFSFNPTNSYSNISPWSVTSGEIYQKVCTRTPYLFFEDGLELSAIITSAGNVGALGRGQFSQNSNILYYRASDGGPPSSHALRAANRGFDGLLGMLNITSLSNVVLNNVVVTHWSVNNAAGQQSAVQVKNSDHITFRLVVIERNLHGLLLDGATNFAMERSCAVENNTLAGVLVQGNVNNLDLSGYYDANGRYQFYQGTSLAYATDGDNIGIGGSGGSMSNIMVHDAYVGHSGAPDNDASAFGSGLYCGTSNSMAVWGLFVDRVEFVDNHYRGAYFGPQQFGGRVSGCAFFGNTNVSSLDQQTLHINAPQQSYAGMVIAQNAFVDNRGRAALYVTGSGTVVIKNNVFHNNGNAGTLFRGDLWLQDSSLQNLTETNNLFSRSGTGWDAGRVITWAAASYDASHVVGVSGGFYQADSGRGQNDIAAFPRFVNTSAQVVRPASGSPLIAAGASAGILSDIRGGFFAASPAIGAVEYASPNRTMPRISFFL